MNDWPYPFWIAHRGGGRLAPENTLAAFRAGAARGYRAFECDVKLSADDRPFLLHDATLERTTDGSGDAGVLCWAELARLDAGAWFDPGFAGEPPPALDDVAAWLRPRGLALNLELKPSPGRDEATGALVAEAVARLWHGDPRPPLLSSFRPAALEAARSAAPALPRGLLLDQLRDGWLDSARALGCVAVITDHALMDSALRERLHAAGMRALVYTVNDPAELQRQRELGIDGVVTDAIDLFVPD